MKSSMTVSAGSAQRPLILDTGQGSVCEPVELSDHEEEEDEVISVREEVGEGRQLAWINVVGMNNRVIEVSDDQSVRVIEPDPGPVERRRRQENLQLGEDDENSAYEESLSKDYWELDPPSQHFTGYVIKNLRLSDATYNAARNNLGTFITYTPEELALLDNEDQHMLTYYSNHSADHKAGIFDFYLCPLFAFLEPEFHQAVHANALSHYT